MTRKKATGARSGRVTRQRADVNATMAAPAPRDSLDPLIDLLVEDVVRELLAEASKVQQPQDESTSTCADD